MDRPEIFGDWRMLVLGLLEYRRRNFTKAVEWEGRCLESAKPNPARAAIIHSVLAMSCHQLGQREAALTELAQARALVETRGARPLILDSPLEGYWYNWIDARQLLREAAVLIDPPGR